MGKDNNNTPSNPSKSQLPMLKGSQQSGKNDATWANNLKDFGLGTQSPLEPKKISLDPIKTKKDLEKSGKDSKISTQSIDSNKQNADAKQNGERCSNFCKQDGFWILPLKYGIERKNVSVPTLPETLKKDYSGLQLNNFNYVAQMVTEGFIYVCIKRQGQAQADWLGYRATKHGYMSYFNVTKPLESDEPVEFACHKSGHSAVASVITLPNKVGKKIIAAYLLFTHDLISTKKREEYESNADSYAQSKKWQKIDPNQWKASQKSDNCLSLNELHYIYNSSNFNAKNGQKGKNVSDGRWEIIKGVFKSKPNFCAAMVLHDPIGITKKLNESRNAQFASLMKFLAEGKNQHKFESSQTVDSLQTIIENKLIRQNLDANVDMNNQTIKLIYAKDKIPQFGTNIDQREYQKRVNEIWERASEAEKKKAIEEYHKKYNVEKTKEEIIIAAQNKSSSEWNKKYKDRFNWDAKNTFDSKVKGLIDTGVKASVNYAKDHLIWIQSKQLLNALYVYDQTTINPYGAAFYTRVMNIMHGMTGTDAGQNLMEKWLLQDKVTPENLYLRAVLYNQKELFSKFESAATSTESLNWDKTQSNIKSFISAMVKADTYWQKWLTSNGDKVEKLGWINPAKYVMFISEVTRTAVKWSLQYNASNAISKSLSRISLIAYAHSSNLSTHVPAYSIVKRLQFIDANKIDSSKIKNNWTNAQRTEIAKKIKNLLDSSTASQALRISSIIAFLELINFGSKSSKLINDPNLQNSTAAISGLFTLASATLDTASKGMEALTFTEKAAKIKVYGATFGIVGAVFTLINDSINLSKEKNGYLQAILVVKLINSLALIAIGFGGLAQISVVESYILKNVEKNIIAHAASKFLLISVAKWAARLTWVGLGLTFLYELAKNYYFDSKLENWCSKSAFGLDESKFENILDENKAFSEALQSI